jgi:hypothetical protein
VRKLNKKIKRVLKLKVEKRNAAIAILTLVVIVLSATTAILAAQQTAYKMNATARVKTIGIKVAFDEAGAFPVTSIDFGEFNPGDSKTVMVYLLNTGNQQLALSVSANNYQPVEAANFVHLTTEMASVLAGKGVTPANLTLTILSNVSGFEEFSLDITIVGTSS